ncbi:MAG TPA: methyltransferase domain-containing protein [Bryobacteraceae bacterium]|jgi:23S rRNA (guanine745-N1)-methyltransferase
MAPEQVAARLVCPVRDCHLALERKDRRLVCVRAHSFDIARSGYVNLLQPQDRRSRNPGDPAEVVAARRALHDQGINEPIVRAIAEATSPSSSDVLLEAGCGDGYYLGSLQNQSGCSAHGVDISTAAIDAAAKRYKTSEWIVANADRFIPYADASFTIVLSIAARMNPPEFQRILKPDGMLLVAVPAPDDLIELRGKGREDRIERTTNEFSKHFEFLAHRRITTHADLDAAAVANVLLSIYRPMRQEPAPAMRVTFSLDLLTFRPSTPRPS